MTDRITNEQLADALGDALALLSSEEVWTQGVTSCAAKSGNYVPFWDDRAKCFCLSGAVHVVAARRCGSLLNRHPLADALFAAIAEMIEDPDRYPDEDGQQSLIIAWNDFEFRTHAQVVVLLTKVRDYLNA